MSLADSILITRPEPGAGETARLVAAMGFVPLVAPALTIQTICAALPSTRGVAAVLVTSGNGLLPCLPAFRDTRLFTVGDATAARARALGFSDVTSAAGDAAALAALIVGRLSPGDGWLLLACGERQGLALAAGLRGAGFRVIRRTVYRSRPAAMLPQAVADALRGGAVRAGLFFSAETARGFVRLIRQAGLGETVRTVDAFAIGAAAGVALEVLPWRRIGVAAKPTQDSMLALLR
jgi:uroporphyrinogen-III synthase